MKSRMDWQCIVLVGVLALAACASTGQEYGAAFSPLPPSTEVAVFAANARIDEPFEVIGQIYYDDRGSFQILSVDSAMEPLKQKARAIGANGLIMERSEPVESGIVSRGIYVEALAVRLTGRSL